MHFYIIGNCRTINLLWLICVLSVTKSYQEENTKVLLPSEIEQESFGDGNTPKGEGIIGAFIFPHGGITLDPETKDYTTEPATRAETQQECIKLNAAMKRAALELVKTKPDLIIFSTPHGLSLQNNFLFVGNKLAEGSFSKYEASVNLDLLSAFRLRKSLVDLNNSVELLTLGVGRDTMPLRWAEVIPWTFIKEAAEKHNFQLPPVVFIGQPLERDIQKLTKFGSDIATVIQNHPELSKKRIAFVVSCDLSHYHSTAPSSPYPFNKASVPFDKYCVDWAKIDRKPENEAQSQEIIADFAGKLAESAGSCGYTGLVMLNGILSKAVANGARFQANFLEYFAPSYFGMMVNYWVPI